MHRVKAASPIIVVSVALLGAWLVLWSASGAGAPPADPLWVESVYTVPHWGMHRHFVDPPPVTTFYKVSSGVEKGGTHTFKSQLGPGIDGGSQLSVVEARGQLNFKFKKQSYDFTMPASDRCWVLDPRYSLLSLYVKGNYLVADVEFYDAFNFKSRTYYLVIWKQGQQNFLYRLKIYGHLANVEW